MKRVLIIAAYISIFSSCYKDIDNSTFEEIEELPEINIDTDLAGYVVNQDGSTLTDYQIIMNGETTDVNGPYFLVSGQDLRKIGQAVEFKKNDELVAFGYLSLIENDLNYVKFNQLPEKNTQTINASSDEQIRINDRINILIESGSSQSDFSARYIEVLSSDIIPYGFTDRDQLVKPKDASVFYLDFVNDQSEAISLLEPIKIQVSNATTEEYLFHFDKLAGKWKEVVQLMPGDVSLDFIRDGLFAIAERDYAVAVEGSIKLEGNENISFQSMELTTSNYSTNIYGSLGGKWIEVAPRQTELNVKLLSPCSQVKQSRNISIESTPIADVDFQVTTSDDYFLVDGSIVDCEGTVLGQSIINLMGDEQILHYPFNKEELRHYVPICSTEFELSAQEIDAEQAGPRLPWNGQIPLAYLTSCPELKEGYSYFTIRDDRKIYTSFQVRNENGVTILESEDMNIRIRLATETIGECPGDDVNLRIEDTEFGSTGYFMSCENPEFECGIQNCLLSHYASGDEEWVRLVVNGQLWMQTISPPTAGYFDTNGVIVCKF